MRHEQADELEDCGDGRAQSCHQAAHRLGGSNYRGRRPLPRNFQCCSPRSSNSVEIAAPTCTLYSPSSKSRSKSSPLAAPSQHGTGRKLAIGAIVSASKLDSLLHAATRSGRQMHHYVRLSPDGDIKVTIH
jgi:hypothetical protein